MLTISVADCAVVPETVTVAGTLHAGGSLAAVGVITQVRLTAPVNPYHGVTETVDVFPDVAPGATLSGAPVSTEKYGVGVVVNEKMAPIVVPRLFCATAW